MINNASDYSMADVILYLSGNTTKFRDISDKVKVTTEKGKYYDKVIFKVEK